MLKVRNLTKYYDSLKAVDNLSFEVKRGEILGIIGENGAGKSTTMKILVGLLKPSSGEVEYFGRNFFENMESIKRRIGYLPEFDPIYENMFPVEYLKFFASVYGVKKEVAEKRIDELIKKLKIPKDLILGSFSKGMRRKISIARTLVHNPDILIYDEPTAGLDPSTSISIIEMLRDLRKEKKIILFSAHNMYYVESLCDKLIIMKNGRAIYYGELSKLKDMMKRYKMIVHQNGVKKEVVIESSDDLNKEIKEIAESGGKIERIDVEVPRLEDIYFKLMK